MVLKVSVEVKADTSDFRRGMDDAQSALNQVTATSKATKDAINDNVNNITNSAKNFRDQAANSAKEIQYLHRNQAVEIKKQATLSREQMLALQYTASDVAASLGSGASPFTVLLQQGGQVLQVFPGVAGAVLGVGAAVAVVAVPLAIVGSRMAEIASQTRELTAIIKAMGNQAGVTAAELRQMAEIAVANGASRDDAYAATLALVRNGHVRDTSMFREILDIAPDVAAVLGTTVANAAEKLGEAFGNGAAGVRKLDDELGFLTVEQAQQIRQMIAQGDQAGALGIAMQALQSRFSGAAVTMRGTWGDAVSEMGRAWNAFIDRLANTDMAKWAAEKAASAARGWREGLREETDEEKAVAVTRQRVELEKELADLQSRTVRNNITAGREKYISQEIERIKKEEDQLYEALRRKAKEIEDREASAPAVGNNSISEGEKKYIDGLRASLEEERQAMKGTSAERQIRLAGLRAERAALEAGRGPQAAKQEGLIAEERARLELNTAISDTTLQLNAEARANLAVAGAYLKSASAGMAAEAYRQAAVENLQSGADVARRAMEILTEQTTSQAASSAKSVATMLEEVQAREKVADAALGGAIALNQAELAAKVEIETMPERIALRNADAETTKYLTEIIGLKTAAILRDAEAEKRRGIGENIIQQQEQIELLKLEISMMGASEEAQRVALAKQQAIIDLRKIGIDVTKNLTLAERSLADAYIGSAEEKARVETVLQNIQKIKETAEVIAGGICDFPDEIKESSECLSIFEEFVS